MRPFFAGYQPLAIPHKERVRDSNGQVVHGLLTANNLYRPHHAVCTIRLLDPINEILFYFLIRLRLAGFSPLV